jgi:hypothetical protein
MYNRLATHFLCYHFLCNSQEQAGCGLLCLAVAKWYVAHNVSFKLICFRQLLLSVSSPTVELLFTKGLPYVKVGVESSLCDLLQRAPFVLWKNVFTSFHMLLVWPFCMPYC